MTSTRRTTKQRSNAKPKAESMIGGVPRSRLERLREALPATVDCLSRRRADLIDEAFIDDYVALHWLEWNGGSLRLTITGSNVCQQLASSIS
jgi:hypothetical protein